MGRMPQTFLGLFSAGVITHRFFNHLLDLWVMFVAFILLAVTGFIVWIWRQKFTVQTIVPAKWSARCFLPSRHRQVGQKTTFKFLQSAVIFLVHPFIFFCIFFAGILWANLFASILINQTIDPILEKKDVEVTGRILGVPVNKGQYTQFDFSVSSLAYENVLHRHPQKIRLKYYLSAQSSQAYEFDANQSWRLMVRLKQARGLQNPGSQFDYESWLFANRIRATGYVREGPDNRLLNSSIYPFSIAKFRSRTEDFIAAHFDHSIEAGILSALIVGLRGNIDEKTWEVLKKTGTIHLVAISGLHISFVSAIMILLSARLWRLTGTLQNKVTAKDMSLIVGVLVAIAYSLLAGMTIPTRRALVMLLAVAFAFLSRRGSTASEVLIFSLFTVLLFDPLSPLSPGFWLSFSAVAILSILVIGNTNKTEGWRNKIWAVAKNWIVIQVGLGLAMAPLLLVIFNQVSFIAPIANLIAVPLVTFFIVPMSMIGLLFLILNQLTLASWFMKNGLIGIDWLLDFLQYIESLGGSVWYPGFRPVWILLFAVIGLITWKARIVRYSGFAGLLWIAPVLFYTPEKPGFGSFKYTMLDVGQGLAGVIETRNHTLIYDTGPGFPSGRDSGKTVIIPYLRYAGIQIIDVLVVSHEHNDHAGGFDSVKEQMEIGKILSGVPHLIAGSEFCHSGQRWQWDGVVFEILWPSAENGISKIEGNNASCVIQVKSEYGKLLLTGDIESAVESSLISEYQSRLESTVIQVPHQGSKTSSTMGFIARVKPKTGLFSAGYKNRFGHPHYKVIERYKNLDIETYSTAKSGAISVVFGPEYPKGAGLIQHRDNITGYWYN